MNIWLAGVVNVLAVAIGVALIALFMSVLLGHAHSWYPPKCCNEGDCHPVPCEEIEDLPKGGAQWGEYKFRPDQVYPTQDSQCHACISPQFNTPYCIFTQQGA